jgi:hypothetical protein
VALTFLTDDPDFRPMPATRGETVKVDLAAFYEIENRKIRHIKMYKAYVQSNLGLAAECASLCEQ